MDLSVLGCTIPIDVPAGGGLDYCRKYPGLVLGHFGDEVVGVLRFYDHQNRDISDQVDCASDPLPCLGCQYIDVTGFDGDQLVVPLKDCSADQVVREQVFLTESDRITWIIRVDGEEMTRVVFNRSSRPVMAAEKSCSCDREDK